VLPVLAVTSGHGAISSLGDVENGIQIWMRQMNSITIDPDGTTATIGGGVLTNELVDTLWAANKYTGKSSYETTFKVPSDL
jgi:FAD/FMN-containing dehydrogenase